jgi:DNA-binding transcriptional MerR regulator
MLLKVGELAKRTGLTVRALHHYDSIGLLRPSGRSDSGYRLYNQADVTQLYRIQTLQRLGFSLAEIGAMLAGAGAALPNLIGKQIAALDMQIAQACALRARLEQLQQSLAADREPELVDWLNTLELMTMYDKYLTAQQTEILLQRKAELGERYQAVWREMVEKVHGLIAAKVPPDDAQAQALTQQWLQHVQALVHGDEGLLIKLDAMHRNEPSLQAQTGLDEAVLLYIGQAMTEARMAIYAKYYSADEVAELRANFQRHMGDWPRLVGEVRYAMESGLAPEHPQARALGQRWQALSHATFGTGDPAKREKFLRAAQNEPGLMVNTGIDASVIAFIKATLEQQPA